jgi:hypothetical protein
VLRDLENAVGQQPMFDVALGSLLNDVVIIELINGKGQWSAARRLRWCVGRWLIGRKKAVRRAAPPSAHQRVLVTWRSSSPRVDELLKPVIEELGPQRCTVLYEKQSVVANLPSEAESLQLFAVLPHEPESWLPEFRRCWPAWKAALKNTCRRYRLSAAAYERLAIELVHGSQVFSGFRQLLQNLRPAAIVTEYDRGARWSCLVLAARTLGIPTFTLQHGVLDEQGVGYVPVVADKIFCWGEIARDVLVQCGVSPERIVLGGCPRLSRQLAVATSQARIKLGLDVAKPVVMLATAPYVESDRTRLVEMFAGCMERMPEAVGIVRLHPSESLDEYRDLACLHPTIRFFDNRAAGLDESLAAADIVVVHNSGIGSDALVKGRLAIVVDLPPSPLGHGRDLVDQAECPCAKSADELLGAARSLLFDDSVRRRRLAGADRFVDRFCTYFGRDSARQIAKAIHEVATSKIPASARNDSRSAVKQESTV